MLTEIEYLKFLQDNGSVIVQDNLNESFFKGTFINVEKSGTIADDKSRLEETHAL